MASAVGILYETRNSHYKLQQVAARMLPTNKDKEYVQGEQEVETINHLSLPACLIIKQKRDGEGGNIQ